MTALTERVPSLATRRIRARGPHPALVDALDRKIVALSARLAARSLTLAEATEALHDIYVRKATQAAQSAAVGMPEPVAEAYVLAQTTRAILEVCIDQERSALDVARAERRLGQVLVLPGGRTEGAKPRPRREPLHPKDLW